MLKETIICIISIAIIIIGNNVSYAYADSFATEITNELQGLRDIISEEEVNSEEANKKMDEVFNYWESKYTELAYFIEHDELEKVQEGLAETKSNVEIEEYKEAVVELDRTVYIINHIQEKLSFKLENIL